MFSQDELPPKDIQNQYEPLIIIFLINVNIIRLTLLDNRYGLNVCSIDLLHKINVDPSLNKPKSLSI